MSRNFLERVLQRGRNGKTRAESSPPRHCFFSMVTDEESLRAVSPEGGKRAVKHGKGGPMRKRGGGGREFFFVDDDDETKRWCTSLFHALAASLLVLFIRFDKDTMVHRSLL